MDGISSIQELHQVAQKLTKTTDPFIADRLVLCWLGSTSSKSRVMLPTLAFFRLSGGFIVKTAMRIVMMTMSRRRRDLGFIISHKHAEHTLNR
jgi:hypothetical protein